MEALSALLLVFSGIGAIYYLLSTIALIACFRGKPVVRSPGFAPRVSILKPVCGVDKGADANFRSYLSLDYPDYDVHFGVLEATDPAIGAILESIEGDRRASMHIGTTIRGMNNKVRVLHQLAKRASGEIIVVTDADTRVRPEFLDAMVAPFESEKVGVVTCMYRGVDGKTAADALEGLHMSAVFAPGVACARWIRGMDFGLGAAIAIRTDVLRRIGGFERIVEYLADDYQLGHIPAQLGYKVELSKYVMEDVLTGQGVRDVLARELRWCRTTRASQPAGHFGLIVTFGSAYSLLYLISTGFSTAGWTCLGATLAARVATAAIGAICLRDREFLQRMWLLPLRDVLSFGIWILGYAGRGITWRGRKMKILRNGMLTESPSR